MSLWWTVRRLSLVVVALTTELLILISTRQREVMAPTWSDGSSTVLPWPALLCLGPALVMARSLEFRGSWGERRSARPVLVADVGAVVATAAVAGALGLALIDDAATGQLAVRNAFILTLAIAAITVQVGSVRASALAISVVILTQSYGPEAPASGVVRIFQQQADPHVVWVLIGTVLVLWPISLWWADRRASC